MSSSKIIYYTKTDEAPALATNSFLPIVKLFTKTANVSVQLKDISLAARILSQFPSYLTESQIVEDDLSFLGELFSIIVVKPGELSGFGAYENKARRLFNQCMENNKCYSINSCG